MKKFYFFVFYFVAAFVNAQTINFPDANFKSKLLEASPANEIAAAGGNYVKIDLNDDGEIQVAEAQLIDSLKINSQIITNLDGVYQFDALKKIDFDVQNVTSFDATVFPQLKSLRFSGFLESFTYAGLISMLEEIELHDMPTLQIIDISHTQISHLALSNLPALKELYFGYTLITEIDLSGVPNLEKLDFEGCGIEYIDLSVLPLLKDLSCYVSEIVVLDVSHNPLLEHILADICMQLESINLTGAVSLKTLRISDALITILDCSDAVNLDVLSLVDTHNLQELLIKNGRFQQFYFEGAFPNLVYICADESEISELTEYSNGTFEVNSYCTPLPAENSNNLSGTVGLDLDLNGCGPTDNTQFFKIKIDDGFSQNIAYTGSNSIYQFAPVQGMFTLTPEVENPALFNIDPPTALVAFTANEGESATRDFCVTPIGIHADIAVSIVTLASPRPGFNARYGILLHNKGNQIVSGTANFQYDQNVQAFSASVTVPTSFAPGVLTYDYSNLRPFESRMIEVNFQINAPTATPPVNIDDVVNYVVSVTTTPEDEMLSDNTTTLQVLVTGAFDPNDKQCLEGDTVNPTQIGEYLHYNINFENTGNAAAENVVVRDLINADQFDLESLVVVFASHPMQARLIGNRAEFLFSGIDLQASEKGNVVFKIKTKSTLITNDIVSNKADIFFDYNFPVATNTASTTFQLLGTEDFGANHSVKIYPNPAHDKVTIESDSNIKSMQLFDVQGRILEVISSGGLKTILDISHHVQGIYYLKIVTDTGSKTEKLIKK